MPAIFIPPARLRASLTSSVGTRNSFAPARRAVTAFCWAPPMGPTLPSARIVPVTATFLRPVRSPGVSSSRIVRVNASPADGPLTRPVSISTFTGKSNFSLRVEVEMPTWARPWQAPCAAARLTTVTGMLLPPRSTVNMTGWPGGRVRTIGPSCSASVTGWPSTAVRVRRCAHDLDDALHRARRPGGDQHVRQADQGAGEEQQHGHDAGDRAGGDERATPARRWHRRGPRRKGFAPLLVHRQSLPCTTPADGRGSLWSKACPLVTAPSGEPRSTDPRTQRPSARPPHSLPWPPPILNLPR